MKKIKTIDAETLLYNPLEQVEYIIEDILPTGLHLFCGASKIGKSWLMLKMCLQVSKGEPLWNLKTKQCDVLYLCLEDTYARIQSRLFKLTDEANDKLHFAISTNKISNGLVMQLEGYLQQKPNTGLIVIDTLQKIRNTNTDSSYASDYGDISILKELADKYKIAIILVHHIRKQNDNDVFNRVSGTTGIMGSLDTTFILSKKAREESTARGYKEI
jgi:RecA-family ATPase